MITVPDAIQFLLDHVLIVKTIGMVLLYGPLTCIWLRSIGVSRARSPASVPRQPSGSEASQPLLDPEANLQPDVNPSMTEHTQPLLDSDVPSQPDVDPQVSNCQDVPGWSETTERMINFSFCKIRGFPCCQIVYYPLQLWLPSLAGIQFSGACLFLAEVIHSQIGDKDVPGLLSAYIHLVVMLGIHILTIGFLDMIACHNPPPRRILLNDCSSWMRYLILYGSIELGIRAMTYQMSLHNVDPKEISGARFNIMSLLGIHVIPTYTVVLMLLEHQVYLQEEISNVVGTTDNDFRQVRDAPQVVIAKLEQLKAHLDRFYAQWSVFLHMSVVWIAIGWWSGAYTLSRHVTYVEIKDPDEKVHRVNIREQQDWLIPFLPVTFALVAMQIHMICAHNGFVHATSKQMCSRFLDARIVNWFSPSLEIKLFSKAIDKKWFYAIVCSALLKYLNSAFQQSITS